MEEGFAGSWEFAFSVEEDASAWMRRVGLVWKRSEAEPVVREARALREELMGAGGGVRAGEGARQG